MASPLPAPVSRLRARRGFALLITITLLAFLVILLVGLATYTRIETAIAGNTQRQTQARQNALYAVNLAVAQLQKHAGPDNRVTATAAAVTGADPQKVRYTGVWDTRAAAGTAPVWLASGLETGTSPDVTTAVTNGIALVGTNTDGSSTANNVVAALQNLTAPGVPGQTGNGTVIGKYAWWVGDNGVKADVARTDVTAQLDYPPFITGATESVAAASDTEMRTRLFQQTGQGAGAFDTASNTAAIEPRDTANQALAANTLAPQQLPFLKNSGGTALGLTALKSHYHTWTVGNHAVLARTKFNSGETSLRTDLSLNPAALGTAFTAWANYPDYMETPAVNALRRRYKLTPAVSDANGSQFSVAPVLSYFAIAFSFRNAVTRNSGATATNNYLECGMHCVVSLWNPYTGALVPEDLEVVVTGLPKVLVTDLASTNVPVDLQTALSDTSVTGAPLVRLSLPAPTALPTDPQPASWLPGRVHSWSVKSGTVPTGGGVLPMEFGVRDLKGEVTLQADPTPFSTTPPFGSPAVTAVTRQCFLDTRTTLTIELRRSDGTTLARFESPAFRSFPSGSVAVDVESHALDFAFVFRLGDPTLDGLAWLQTTGLDVRNPALGSGSITPFVFAQNSEDPTQVVLDTAGKNVLTFATG
ncbi:MAG: hypothetical protein NTV51_03310, partial [Verrucomicrobia bacterium]|nr:hypothetical protein [Verrucomicrobiota bacterium]